MIDNHSGKRPQGWLYPALVQATAAQIVELAGPRLGLTMVRTFIANISLPTIERYRKKFASVKVNMVLQCTKVHPKYQQTNNLLLH